MNKVLVTGATGNVGEELVKIFERENNSQFIAAVTDINKAENKLSASVEMREFDFTDAKTFPGAMKDVNRVFLLRPPAISDVRRDIFPFLEFCRRAQIEQIALLSILGAEKIPFIPHRRIEMEILRLKIPYTFLRPSFFMQNLSTTHREEIRRDDEIYVPAGNGKTSFVDVRDVAEVAFASFFDERHLNRAYALTGDEALSYYQVAEIFSEVLGKKIRYADPFLLSFIIRSYFKRGNLSFVLIMAAIYTTAKFGLAGQVTSDIKKVLGRSPISLRKFIKDYAEEWL